MVEVLFYSQVFVVNFMKKNFWVMFFLVVIYFDFLVFGLNRMVLLGYYMIGLVLMGYQVDGIVMEIEIVNECVFYKNGMQMKEVSVFDFFGLIMFVIEWFQ